MKKTEVWKQIIIDGEAWDYEVSDMGNIRRIGNSECLKTCIKKDGYSIVHLYRNGKDKTVYVHRLVAQAFIQNPNNLSDVNHKNENKTDNRVNNLEWMSHKNNINYGTRNERSARTVSKTMREQKGKKVMGISLTENKVIVFQSTQQAEKFGFKHGNICNCCNGERKSHHGYKWKYLNNKEQK